MLESRVRERGDTAPLISLPTPTIPAPTIPAPPITSPPISSKADAAARARWSADLGLVPRIVAAVVLSLVAYGVGYADVLSDALDGSRAALLVVAPLLAALIATGYRSAPTGVGDGESDWILAILVGGLGFGAIELLTRRAPTLAELWGLHLFGAVLWLACCLTVLFGVRHVVRMWPMWAYAIVCTTPLPFLLATAAFGGSDTVANLLAALLGAVAVLLATRTVSPGRRTAFAAATFAVAALVAVGATGRLGVFTTVIVVAGVIPVCAVILSTRIHRPTAVPSRELGESLPRRTASSVVVLGVVAVTLLIASPPAVPAMEIPTVDTDWTSLAGLSASESLPAVAQILGPQATAVRYEVSSRTGSPTAAVDVISAPDAARLDDIAAAVFYPSSRPVDYETASNSAHLPAGARILYSNADAATDATGIDWYAVSWLWRTQDAYQRVTVIVSQKLDSDQLPPLPQRLTLHDTALRPTMWLARQQPDTRGAVDPRVTSRAAEVISLITGHDGG